MTLKLYHLNMKSSIAPACGTLLVNQSVDRPPSASAAARGSRVVRTDGGIQFQSSRYTFGIFEANRMA